MEDKSYRLPKDAKVTIEWPAGRLVRITSNGVAFDSEAASRISETLDETAKSVGMVNEAPKKQTWHVRYTDGRNADIYEATVTADDFQWQMADTVLFSVGTDKDCKEVAMFTNVLACWREGTVDVGDER